MFVSPFYNVVHNLDVAKMVPNRSSVNINIVCAIVLIVIFSHSVLGAAGHLEKLYLPDPGPASFAFDLKGEGPYTSVADGRILKYEGPLLGFVEYGYTNPNRPAQFCDGTNSTELAKICGRPLGLGFYYKTGELYIADAAFGLVVIGPGGGPGKQLATSAEDLPFGIPDGLEVDQETGIIYFTDSSARYNISQIPEILANNDTTGRLLRYDPKTKNVTVLLSGLAASAGVAISKDGSFLLVTESVTARVQKYWLKGPLANTAQVLLNLSGVPDKIKRNLEGDFWIALTAQSQKPTPAIVLQGQRISGNGEILETLTFSPQFNTTLITEVQEYKDALYLGSLYVGYVGVYWYSLRTWM